ncbi:MAG: hypothetical protein A2W22_05535 [Candidatus Levybacteria bacterium RBG_16_35_11]|nr:MAG: hypothetical protein A2W22_05535 [Candidatus Levybacteria bacterium RBG_16_35_11]
MNNIDEITEDHLFQVNLILWLTQPILSDIGIRALLAESGYSVYSIAPSLALPIPIRQRIREKNINAQDGCSPDIILGKEKSNFFLLVECKKQSFGPDSSTSEQARTLLLLDGQILGESLALSPATKVESAVSYVTKDDHKLHIKNTCDILKSEIESAGFRSNYACCFGIKHDSENSIYIVINNNDSDKLNIRESGDIKVIEGQPNTDPRPLYFIPLDPSVEQNEYGKKTLEQRLLSEILSLIGRAKVSDKTVFTVEDLLVKATWGMYNSWSDNSARKNLRRQVNSFLKNKIASSFPQHLLQEKDAWILSIESTKDKETLLSSLLKTEKIEELSKEQLELFEEDKKLLE